MWNCRTSIGLGAIAIGMVLAWRAAARICLRASRSSAESTDSVVQVDPSVGTHRLAAKGVALELTCVSLQTNEPNCALALGVESLGRSWNRNA